MPDNFEYSATRGFIGAPRRLHNYAYGELGSDILPGCSLSTAYPVSLDEAAAIKGVLDVFEQNRQEAERLAKDRAKSFAKVLTEKSDLHRRIEALETTLRTVARIAPFDAELKQLIQNAGVSLP